MEQASGKPVKEVKGCSEHNQEESYLVFTTKGIVSGDATRDKVATCQQVRDVLFFFFFFYKSGKVKSQQLLGSRLHLSCKEGIFISIGQ